jgi:vitamin B12 transporter
VTTSFNPYASQYFNVGRTRARGTELSIDVVPVDTLRIRAGHTFLASRIVDSTSPGNEVFRPGAWTFRRPRQSGFLEVSADLGRLSLDLTGVFVGRRVDSDFSSLVPAITESNPPNLWNAGVRYRATTRMELYGRVQNLTNADYMDPPGYPAWRRTGAVGLRIGLGR